MRPHWKKGWLRRVREKMNKIELAAWRQAVVRKQSVQSIYAHHMLEPSPCKHTGRTAKVRFSSRHGWERS